MSESTENIDDAACFVCRCEEVSEEAVLAAIAAGARSLNDVKRRTRAGMGLCQGIYCLPAVGALIHARADIAPEEIVPMTARPPVRMAALERLAATED